MSIELTDVSCLCLLFQRETGRSCDSKTCGEPELTLKKSMLLSFAVKKEVFTTSNKDIGSFGRCSWY